MAILIVCPGCRKRFQVSEQFAGRTGPCPSCKTPIKIPGEGEEVKVHAPEEFSSGGRTTKGRLILKPVAHEDVHLSPLSAAIGGVIVVAVVAVAMVINSLGSLQPPDSWTAILVKAIGLVLLSPALVVSGYSFLRDDELEPYRGISLYLRAAIVALAYVILWGLFGQFGLPILQESELWMWLVIATPFVLLGGLAGLATLDLEFGSAMLLYSFYLLVTILLRGLAGGGWIWETIATL